MQPLDHLGITAEDLLKRVHDEVWQRWVDAEPILGELRSLEELAARRGADADQLLGCLVRLAAADGGDDELAAIVVIYQLSSELRRTAYSLRDLSSDIDLLALTDLWIHVRGFPWRRVTRAYATHLVRSTRRSLLAQLRPKSAGDRRLVLIPPEELAAHTERQLLGVVDGLPLGSARAELVDYLTWCVAVERITQDDSTLMLQLAAAGWATLHLGVLDLKRGVCSLHAAREVADTRGVSVKTVLRDRDRILVLLREAATDYLRLVA